MCRMQEVPQFDVPHFEVPPLDVPQFDSHQSFLVKKEK
jgi:hypothetical protein